MSETIDGNNHSISFCPLVIQTCGVFFLKGFWSLRLDFVAKMASSQDATSPCDLLQGLVPTCVLTLILKTLRCTHLLQLFLPDIYGTDQHGEI